MQTRQGKNQALMSDVTSKIQSQKSKEAVRNTRKEPKKNAKLRTNQTILRSTGTQRPGTGTGAQEHRRGMKPTNQKQHRLKYKLN